MGRVYGIDVYQKIKKAKDIVIRDFEKPKKDKKLIRQLKKIYKLLNN